MAPLVDRANDFCSSGARFTSCYDQTSTQEDIFQADVEPLIDVVYSGVVSIKSIVSTASVSYKPLLLDMMLIHT